MKNFLNDILEHKRHVIAANRDVYARYQREVKPYQGFEAGRFRHAIVRMGRINAIMELKKASPSRGVICQDFDLQKIARTYADHGAAAFSVLTEDKFFLGKPEYIRELSSVFETPILTKDFILDAGQIYQARANKAAAVLLIVRMLDDAALKDLMQVTYGLGMDALVEVHDQPELDRAIRAGADIIGVNNRNLDTFVVDMATSDRLIPQIVSSGKVAVVESGIKSHEDIVHIRQLGAHAVLIGEAFMSAPDIGKKIKDVMGE